MTKKLILPILAISTGFLVSCGCGGGGSTNKHKIKFTGDHYFINYEEPQHYTKEVEQGKPIGKITGITPDYGYYLTETIKIDAFKEGYTWDKDKGTIDFGDLKMPDKDITIEVKVSEE